MRIKLRLKRNEWLYEKVWRLLEFVGANPTKILDNNILWRLIILNFIGIVILMCIELSNIL